MASVLGSMLAWNNRRIEVEDRTRTNPRPLGDCAWHLRLADAHPEIAREWHRFSSAGGLTPRIEDVLTESQGNVGDWNLGLLVSAGRPTALGRASFPATLGALDGVPGLRHAMFSVLAPGAQIPIHHGPNSGVLRYHLGVDCGTASVLTVGPSVVAYRDGEGILFDDTEDHAAANRGTTQRVTLFCELLRPLPLLGSARNRVVQWALGLDPRYRRAVDRADEWNTRLNPTSRR